MEISLLVQGKSKSFSKRKILFCLGGILFIILFILFSIIYASRDYKLNPNDLILIHNESLNCNCPICAVKQDCFSSCDQWIIPYFGPAGKFNNPNTHSHCSFLVPSVPSNSYLFKYEMLVSYFDEDPYINLSWTNSENQVQQVSLEILNGPGSIEVEDVETNFKIYVQNDIGQDYLFLRDVRFVY